HPRRVMGEAIAGDDILQAQFGRHPVGVEWRTSRGTRQGAAGESDDLRQSGPGGVHFSRSDRKLWALQLKVSNIGSDPAYDIISNTALYYEFRRNFKT